MLVKFSVVTLFPEALQPYLSSSMMWKATQKGIAEFELVNLRDFGLGPHKSVDDTPYGGGDGMLLRCEPAFAAIESIKAKSPHAKVIIPTPGGQLWTQRLVEQFKQEILQAQNSGEFDKITEPSEIQNQAILDRTVEYDGPQTQITLDKFTKNDAGKQGSDLDKNAENGATGTVPPLDNIQKYDDKPLRAGIDKTSKDGTNTEAKSLDNNIYNGEKSASITLDSVKYDGLIGKQTPSDLGRSDAVPANLTASANLTPHTDSTALTHSTAPAHSTTLDHPTAPAHYIIFCPHYEGLDARILTLADYQISLGKYILTGGELPALIIIDSIVRLLPGVLGGAQSAAIESFSAGDNLEYPQYTKPYDFRGMTVPDILLSGNHGAVDQWRADNSGTFQE